MTTLGGVGGAASVEAARDELKILRVTELLYASEDAIVPCRGNT